MRKKQQYKDHTHTHTHTHAYYFPQFYFLGDRLGGGVVVVQRQQRKLLTKMITAGGKAT